MSGRRRYALRTHFPATWGEQTLCGLSRYGQGEGLGRSGPAVIAKNLNQVTCGRCNQVVLHGGAPQDKAAAWDQPWVKEALRG